MLHLSKHFVRYENETESKAFSKSINKIYADFFGYIRYIYQVPNWSNIIWEVTAADVGGLVKMNKVVEFWL